MEYFEYLKSDRWSRKRIDALRRAKNRCQICNSKGKLNVHHRTYERIFKEAKEDLVVLCERCHELFHNIMPKYKKPVLVDIKIKARKDQNEFDEIDRKLRTCTDEVEIKKLLRRCSELSKKRLIV